jgi:U6 snRNA-associated Sm-like protein LSm1
VSIAPTSGIPYGHVPAYLPGSSSLVEELDKRILMVLRDGRHLVGVSVS